MRSEAILRGKSVLPLFRNPIFPVILPALLVDVLGTLASPYEVESSHCRCQLAIYIQSHSWIIESLPEFGFSWRQGQRSFLRECVCVCVTQREELFRIARAQSTDEFSIPDWQLKSHFRWSGAQLT